MIPDKIYIQKEDGKTITLNKVHDTDIEYISKDALFEWAKEMISEIANERDDYYVGKRIAFREVIDKINSL